MEINISNIKFIKNSPKNYWENIIQHNSNKYEQLSSIDKFKNNKIHIVKSQNNKNNAKNNDDIKQTCIDIQLILKKYIKINKKKRVNVYDCIYLVAYKLINNHSYQDVSDDLFCSEGIFLGNDKISKKLNNINSDILLKINDELVHYIKNKFKPIHLLKSTIKSIDGSDLCADIGLSKHGYDKTDTHRYSTPYASFLNNYNYGIIEKIIISKKYNERKDANTLILNDNDNNNTIYIEDAGYFSHLHTDKIHKSNKFFIIRLPSDGKLIKSIKYKLKDTNEIFYYSLNNKYKIVQYFIKNIKNNKFTEYHVITNKLDLTEDEIKNYYHFRWDVEVKINIFKNKLGGNFYNTKKEKGLYNTIHIQHFIFLLSYIFSRLSENIIGETYTINKKINIDKTVKQNSTVTKKDFHKININSAIRITTNSLLYSLIYEKYDSIKMNNCINRIHSNQILSILGRTFIHKPTKEDINNKIKETFKKHTKNNVKLLYGVEIYKNFNYNDVKNTNEQFVLRFD